MIQRALQVFTIVVGFGLAGTASACECIVDKKGNIAIESLMPRSDSVVHAKVIGLNGSREARIEVIEVFKGQPPTVLRGKAGGGTNCGWKFEVGEEEIFFVYHGKVSVCSRSQVTVDLVNRLRALKR